MFLGCPLCSTATCSGERSSLLSDFVSIPTVVMCRGLQSASPVPSVPDRVQALVGSCVVIPCSFSAAAPHPRGQRPRVDVRLRYRGGGRFFPLQSTAFNSQDKDQVSRDFQGRASLFGKIEEGDCSVRMERIRLDDPQMFEVALKRREDLLWGRPSTVQIDIMGESINELTANSSLPFHLGFIFPHRVNFYLLSEECYFMLHEVK